MSELINNPSDRVKAVIDFHKGKYPLQVQTNLIIDWRRKKNMIVILDELEKRASGESKTKESSKYLIFYT